MRLSCRHVLALANEPWIPSLIDEAVPFTVSMIMRADFAGGQVCMCQIRMSVFKKRTLLNVRTQRDCRAFQIRYCMSSQMRTITGTTDALHQDTFRTQWQGFT